MGLKPGEEIWLETHDDRDQFFRVEKGSGEVLIDGVCTAIKGDDGIIVPAGAQHNIVNTGDKLLQLYTIYGPPEHIDRSEEHTSELQSPMRISYAVFCLKKKKKSQNIT